MKKRGILIVFEGIDRCGKSTQTNLLKEYFIKEGLQTKLLGKLKQYRYL